jgi:sigma-B regulation protein RsbU (phosphoserine phosphatase)
LHPFLLALALIFAASALLYAVLWMAAVRQAPSVELGYDDPYLASGHAMLVRSVTAGSPAEKAGVLPGDRIIAIYGRAIRSADFQTTVWRQHQPGDTVQLTIRRSGRPEPMVVTGVFRARLSGNLTEYVFEEVRDLYPVPFVVVGLAVLFLRLTDPRAWLLALLFASFLQTPGQAEAIVAMTPLLGPFALAYKALFQAMLGPLFYFFFAVFPNQSPLDRRVPWLKWVALALGIFFGLPGLRTGNMQIPLVISNLLGPGLSQKIVLFHVYGFITLGLISLAVNFYSTHDPESRRKLRVILWGAAVGVGPPAIERAAEDFGGFGPRSWMNTLIVLVLAIFPLSLAYAVVKHRVLEIPVLLKRSARYLLVQRGFTILLALASVGLTFLFASFFALHFERLIEAAQPSGIALGVVFGSALLWGGSQVHKHVSGRIDRAFFRSAYDARVILEDLAANIRRTTGRAEIAQLLQRHLMQALRPSSLIIYFQGGDHQLIAASGAVPGELSSISMDVPLLSELAERGQPWDFPPADQDGAATKSTLEALHPDCLAPMLGRGAGLVGLLVLGRRLSDEPYSGEDKRLLASVASQAATALENITLAEEIAERLEAERRTAVEMEIAKEVQDRLLPQAPVRLKTLDCAAQCIQARSVGGDYYDFLDLGPQHVGLVLADVSGKGVHAALLVANLQAHLRSQSGIVPEDPVRMLQVVNRMIWKSTSPEHYATLFYALYDDSTRRLKYVNCGHNPPILMHRDGSVERLAATATVIGLFERWESTVREAQLTDGDVLVVFSDGVTEAERSEDEEFGEERLIDELRATRHLAAIEIVSSILNSVQQFSAGAQSDDLTLLIARAREMGVTEPRP